MLVINALLLFQAVHLEETGDRQKEKIMETIIAIPGPKTQSPETSLFPLLLKGGVFFPAEPEQWE